jgi:lysophospholipase L1-like esterase
MQYNQWQRPVNPSLSNLLCFFCVSILTVSNHSWPDILFTRLQSNPGTASISILNQAAGGNRILADGNGPNVLSRLDRDVLSQSGVKYVLIFEGVNDIGTAEPNKESQAVIGDRLIAGYKQVVTRVHAHGIPIFAATITPFGLRKEEHVIDAEAEGITGYAHPTREPTRQRVNEWIRSSGVFDAVIDFDQVLKDEEESGVLRREFDSGDRLHPNTQAFKALAESFPVEAFDRV